MALALHRRAPAKETAKIEAHGFLVLVKDF